MNFAGVRLFRRLVGYRAMQLTLETEQETDGRWLAEVPELAGVMAFGSTRAAAMAKAEALAFRVLAERLEHDEAGPMPISFSLAAE
jgi:predicted RNase H-like HicB family nuclease